MYELSICCDCLLALRAKWGIGTRTETLNYAPTAPDDYSPLALSALEGLTPVAITDHYGFRSSSVCNGCGSWLGGDRWELSAIDSA